MGAALGNPGLGRLAEGLGQVEKRGQEPAGRALQDTWSLKPR